MTSYQFIKTPEEFASYLDQTRSCEWIGFDTEFISEGKYRADLCLLQVATSEGQTLIDAPAVGDLAPFWERICDPATTVIVHSGRSEMEFCFRSIGRLPEKLFDVQLAAGFVGVDYPSGFKKLCEEILRIDLPKGETRTDWRKRPLSLLQIEYALCDVCYLEEMTERLKQRLVKEKRLDWFREESAAYLARMASSFVDDRWMRVSGAMGLGRVELAILRELWNWRDRKAAKENRPAARLLRDDLIVELAKRKSADQERIGALRGLARRNDLETLKVELAEAIRRGLAIPNEELPLLSSRLSYPTYPVIVPFLMTALQNVAKKSGVAIQLLASPQDVRDFVARRDGKLPEEIPVRLETGWRAELLGSLLDDLLEGKLVLRLAGLGRNDPLELVDFSKNSRKK